MHPGEWFARTSPEQHWIHLGRGGCFEVAREDRTYTARGIAGEPDVYVLISKPAPDAPAEEVTAARAVTSYPEILDLMLAQAPLTEWRVPDPENPIRKEPDHPHEH